MSQVTVTIVVLGLFIAVLLFISKMASRSNVATPKDFYLANRGLGTVVMAMTTGASYFSTWTLLGAIGQFYRDGVWFIAFAAWAIVHAMYIWIFGSRFWFLGKKFNFITPGDLMEKYYSSSILRILYAVIGVFGLIPYMLIQVTGGAMALESLTNNAIPYWIGVLIMGVFVGVIVTMSGGRGAAWSDTFMGFFFGFVLLGIVGIFIVKAGGFSAFKQVADVAPEVLTNKGNFWGILETALGLGCGFFVMPQMWQKFYSVESPQVLAKTALITPFWNSWIMALGTLIIGILAHTPNLVPGLTDKLADRTIPLFFSTYAPFFGSVVVAAIIAAGISTINSALLTSASLFANDIYTKFMHKGELTPEKETHIGKICVVALTAMVVLLAFIPAAQGYIVQVASLGYGTLLQLVPAVFGPLFWSRGTAKGAIASILSGEAVYLAVVMLGSPLPLKGGCTGLIVAAIVFVGVSLLTHDKNEVIKREFHDAMDKVYALDDNTQDKNTKVTVAA